MNPNSSDNRYEHVIESLKFLFEKYRCCDEGTLATYIPELSKADPSWLGIALADVDGNVLEFGDSQIEFTIQSVSKPFIFGAALDVLGRDEVLKRVGVEPSGDSFNGIEFQKGERPYNAMINPGAILATSLIPGSTAVEKISRILDILSKAAGRQLTIDENTYRSESETGHRNRAIGHLLRILNLLEQDIDEVLAILRIVGLRIAQRRIHLFIQIDVSPDTLGPHYIRLPEVGVRDNPACRIVLLHIHTIKYVLSNGCTSYHG